MPSGMPQVTLASGRLQALDFDIRISRSAFGLTPFPRHRLTKSFAAAVHSGNWNSNPDCNSRSGATRRLFRMSSVSVRRKIAPSSSIHVLVGRPNGAPQACRKIRMNSRDRAPLRVASRTRYCARNLHRESRKQIAVPSQPCLLILDVPNAANQRRCRLGLGS